MGKACYEVLLLISTILLFSSVIPQNASEIIPSTIQESKSFNDISADFDQPSISEKNNSPITLWYRTYGGINDDCAYSIVLDSDGGYVLAGYTYSFGAGGCDAWIIKTDYFGNMQWNKTYGGFGHDEAHSIIRTSDGGFAIAGVTDSFGLGGFDAWLIKTDSGGNPLWNKTFGGSGNDEAWSIIEDADGGFAIAGWTTSFGMGGGDFWLIKTDASGNVEWNRTYGDIFFEAANSLKKTRDDGFILAGSTYSYGAGGSDFWLVKTDNLGNVQWNRTYGGPGEDYGFSVVQTFDGGYAIAGSTNSFGAGVYDFWLVKTDYSGQHMWNKTYGGSGYDEAWLIMQTSNNELALVGWTESFGSGNSDCWLIVTDSQGEAQWNQTWGGENNDYAYSAILGIYGQYILCGQTRSLWTNDGDILLITIWKIEGGGAGGGTHMPLAK
jgi:predicted secreted protein